MPYVAGGRNGAYPAEVQLRCQRSRRPIPDDPFQTAAEAVLSRVLRQNIFSQFGRIFQRDFDGSPTSGHPELPKNIHTERHQKLRQMLVARRKSAGLTQTVVAERLGKPPSYVAKYEGGDRRLDMLEFLDVASAIGFDPCVLIRALLRKG